MAQGLARLFERHRLVFWSDRQRELRGDFEALALDGVEKLELSNNEFGLKHRLLREQPEQKFLLYREGPQPDDPHNWLLDLQLAHGEFSADQVSIWLSELGLGREFEEVTRACTPFFRSAQRRRGLKSMLEADDGPAQAREKMVAVCAGSAPRIDSVVEALLEELAADGDAKARLISRCGLEEFLWERMERHYGYRSGEPGVRDFAIGLFKFCYAEAVGGEAGSGGEGFRREAEVFFKRWKDSRQHADSFMKLSEMCAEVLGVEQDLAARDFRDLLEVDYFRLIDQKIIGDLARTVEERTANAGEVSSWIRSRRQGPWHEEYCHLYAAIRHAARFMQALTEAELEMISLAEGVERYCGAWYRIDQLYRKFVFHARAAGQASLLDGLHEEIENRYSNQFLLPLGDRFSEFVDATDWWGASDICAQSEFFTHWVAPFLQKGNRICVIISDALRYESAEELARRIRSEDRYAAELEPALSMLPSYTQLGMAALLPHKALEIAANDSGAVLVDGRSSQGTANRKAILQQAVGERATALLADKVMVMTGPDCRAWVQRHDLIYVYHNRIDATGDKRDSEALVFKAVEDTFDELILLMKKLAGANVNNLLVTADHGFLYQHRPIDESDFSAGEPIGREVLVRNRRFVLGRGLSPSLSLHTFKSARLGLRGDVEIQLPRSINRLRRRGAGSRFVHGGATLQEVVVPVIRVNKKRRSDVRQVDVEVLGDSGGRITSGQLAVRMYQAQPVTDKARPRVLRAGIFDATGQRISDSHEFAFDIRSDNPRERELAVRFVLSRGADEANGQDVFLRLEEKVAGTSHYKEYKSLRYIMQRSFTTDFDF